MFKTLPFSHMLPRTSVHPFQHDSFLSDHQASLSFRSHSKAMTKYLTPSERGLFCSREGALSSNEGCIADQGTINYDLINVCRVQIRFLVFDPFWSPADSSRGMKSLNHPDLSFSLFWIDNCSVKGSQES